MAIEGRILWELQHKPHHATVLLVDNDDDFLAVISQGLVEHGYSVMSANSPENALEKLTSAEPDLIICDIGFDNSSMDGFALYKKVRENKKFAAIPFLFVSGIKDEWVVQQGLEIGADQFISKPFTITILVAAIEGKLLRYEEIKQALRR